MNSPYKVLECELVVFFMLFWASYWTNILDAARSRRPLIPFGTQETSQRWLDIGVLMVWRYGIHSHVDLKQSLCRDLIAGMPFLIELRSLRDYVSRSTLFVDRGVTELIAFIARFRKLLQSSQKPRIGRLFIDWPSVWTSIQTTFDTSIVYWCRGKFIFECKTSTYV